MPLIPKLCSLLFTVVCLRRNESWLGWQWVVAEFRAAAVQGKKLYGWAVVYGTKISKETGMMANYSVAEEATSRNEVETEMEGFTAQQEKTWNAEHLASVK